MELLTTYHGVVAALVLALAHLLADRLLARAEALPGSVRRNLVSAAAGASVAYVFVDVLPELAHHQGTLLAALGEAGARFAEQRIYLLALLAFVVFYGLEHLVLAHGDAHHTEGEEGRDAPHAAAHLLAFAAYAALIGALLVERAEDGFAAIAIYTTAMALHFLIVAHALRERFPEAHARWGRWLLAASVLAGWAVGMRVGTSGPAAARIFAVVAGGVVITSLQRELPGTGRGRFWPFVLGSVAFALLLLWA
jgi:hypothetical protein